MDTSNESTQKAEKIGWRFPATFWYANGAELCERAAYYGMFITLFRYLNVDIGFTDMDTGTVIAVFAGGIYFLPTFMGIMADKIGFKKALMLAFSLLTAGYAVLGAFQLKSTAMIALALIMCGGAIIKPVIAGTVAKCSDSAHRARAMSIFYMVVNIGSFSGKGLAGVLNEKLGLQYINFYAAGMSFAALILVTGFYRNVDTAGTGKTLREALHGLGKVLRHVRFLSLIVIIAGFWLIQGQLYGAMPTFIERVLGKGYKPEWLANINPLTVVILVVPVTHLIRRFRPENAIGVGLFIIPFTALVIALGSLAQANLGDSINLGLYTGNPLVLAIIIGIMLQGLAECFLSPKFLEYASKQAPKGEIGLYLGYQHLTTFLAWSFGFLAAGFLLDRYCPDPRKLDAPTRHQWRLATDPNYRFTLSEPFRGELVDNVPVSPSLAQVLRDAGLGLPGDPRLVKLKTKDDWKSDPERAWAITEGLFTVEERVRDASDERTIHVVPAEHHGADGKGLEREGFVLDGGVGDYFDDGEPLGERGRLALAEHGIAVSEAAIVRAREIGESGSAGDRWRVALERYHIEEAKLEADADAKENGRERALRDVLVYAHTARAPETTPPLPDEYAHAHHIWYAFSGVGFAAFIGLLVFKFVTGSIDRRQAAAESHSGG